MVAVYYPPGQPEVEREENERYLDLLWEIYPAAPNLRGCGIGDDMIERVDTIKLLGVSCQSNMKWNSHIKKLPIRGNRRLHHLRQCKKAHLPAEVGLATYCTKIRPLLEYAAYSLNMI